MKGPGSGKETAKRDTMGQSGKEKTLAGMKQTHASGGLIEGYDRVDARTGKLVHVQPYHKNIITSPKPRLKIGRKPGKATPTGELHRVIAEMVRGAQIGRGEPAPNGKKITYGDFDVLLPERRMQRLGLTAQDANRLAGATAKTTVTYTSKKGNVIAKVPAELIIKRAHQQDDGVSLHFNRFAVPVPSQESGSPTALIDTMAKITPELKVTGIEGV